MWIVTWSVYLCFHIHYAIHKLAGMLHKDEVIWAARQEQPEEPSTLQCNENMFAWDDDSEAALMCNEVHDLSTPFPCTPSCNEQSEYQVGNDNGMHSSDNAGSQAPDFHNCAKHVENNLLDKFKYGEALRDLFRQAVHTWHEQEKLQLFEQIGEISIAARRYCEELDQHMLFRANSPYAKFDMYTNQPTESLNWVLRPARTRTRFLLLKTIEAWFLKQQAARKAAHERRLIDGYSVYN